MTFAALSRSTHVPAVPRAFVRKLKSVHTWSTLDSQPRFVVLASPVNATLVQKATPIQANSLVESKLKLGKPNDKFEAEADRIADKVMRMPEPQPEEKTAILRSASPARTQRVCRECNNSNSWPVGIQRLCADCEDKLHRQPIEGEELVIQRKEISALTPKLTRDVQARIDGLRGGGQPLPKSLQAFFEPRFGVKFIGVRVHADKRSAQLAEALNARAFTAKNDVVFAADQYAPGTTFGRRLLAHELTHVVQQRGTFSFQVSGSPANFLQRQADDEARRIRFRCGPGGMGCDLTMNCDEKPCALSDCGRGRCPTCPKGLGNLIVRHWCAYRCMPSGSAFYLVSRIGNWKFLKTCLDE